MSASTRSRRWRRRWKGSRRSAWVCGTRLGRPGSGRAGVRAGDRDCMGRADGRLGSRHSRRGRV